MCRAQVQAVTSVGGGDFSTPVTVSLREPSPDSNSGSSSNVIAAAVVAVTLTLGLIVTAQCAYICWYVYYVLRLDLNFVYKKNLKINLPGRSSLAMPEDVTCAFSSPRDNSLMHNFRIFVSP